ncbi:class I SAM-dependent methyltransferase [Rhodopseudomonas sp. B29]|uniref:class I SAM-dependent methyltransferase n=1 Tax=Rhodopseudomonas sp. B29 TaxID=95607 RepID=UPI000346D38F|nr:class I SAM-dependent methyltransferase [Rhodopseudomonas sp. B29]
MQTGQPSRTAWGAASLRAAHQIVDGGLIFSDPLALRILGADADQLRAEADEPGRQRLRWFIAMRSRLAEDLLTAAAARGVAQLVVLGAGLDTYAYRSPIADRLTVFEVDHPATQQWKRDQLARAGIAAPATLRYVPVDFERDMLADRLLEAGHDPDRPTFFTWLGVVPYLTEDAIFATLRFIAGLPGGAEVVFDYSAPAEAIASQDGRAARAALEARVAAAGERLLSHFQPADLAAKLAQIGFVTTDDYDSGRLAARYLPGRTHTGSGGGAHILHAMTTRP